MIYIYNLLCIIGRLKRCIQILAEQDFRSGEGQIFFADLFLHMIFRFTALPILKIMTNSTSQDKKKEVSQSMQEKGARARVSHRGGRALDKYRASKSSMSESMTSPAACALTLSLTHLLARRLPIALPPLRLILDRAPSLEFSVTPLFSFWIDERSSSFRKLAHKFSDWGDTERKTTVFW